MTSRSEGRALGGAAAAALAALTLAFPAAAAQPTARSGAILCDGVRATIVSTRAAAVVAGTPRRDVIVVKGAGSVVRAGSGNDLVCALRASTVSGGPGDDRLLGSSSADVLNGDAGNDTIRGGAGNDRVSGGAGQDVIDGGAGRDRVAADTRDTVVRGAGDTVTGRPTLVAPRPGPSPAPSVPAPVAPAPVEAFPAPGAHTPEAPAPALLPAVPGLAPVALPAPVAVPGPVTAPLPVDAPPASVWDLVPPSAPTGLYAEVRDGGIGLHWAASADNVGVAGYDVWSSPSYALDDALTYVGYTTGTTAFDTPADRRARHYLVMARDAAGNTSDRSASVAATLGLDDHAPRAPDDVLAATTSEAVTLSWRSGGADDVGVSRYIPVRSTSPGFETGVDGVETVEFEPQAEATFVDHPPAAGATYHYAVVALDAAGNRSERSAGQAVSLTGDAAAPSEPTDVTVTSAAHEAGVLVSLSWGAAADDVGVAGYVVQRSPAPGFLDVETLGTTASTGAVDLLLLGSPGHHYRVVAVDAAGRRSGAVVAASSPAGG
ncbi:hypothetical protein [Motilibacter aurantiacus]|uniref:hypothetical protein n=1 Tax=Motilibacter aurantiacus TaxID=2714955 RepID=UPI00140E74AA|nr:hypothetical protein [Motilibacter aurantiacus]NHC47126.1 hypothetical protein [Motilibacter aurantiacus]